MNQRFDFQSIASVAYKEFLHIYRDRRILILLLVLPPVFTLIFGHAFESPARTDTPALIRDTDGSERSARFITVANQNKAFKWRLQTPSERVKNPPDLLGNGVLAALVIPPGWGASLSTDNPQPLQLFLDGSDTNTADELSGDVQQTLGDFKQGEQQVLIDNLPEEVFTLGKKLPAEIRDRFAAIMTPWTTANKVLYNPRERFIDYVLPGIIGLILQLLTVTLTACTIARERESGTLYQLMVTSLKRSEIVVGKMLPYLGISILLILVIIGLAGWHFQVAFHSPLALAVICLLFLLCSLGLGLLISAFSRTQTQAIQLSVFFLLPVFVLSGAFAPLEQLPDGVRWLSECFPLTHFCRGFRFVNLYQAPLAYVYYDLAMLLLGAVVTFAGAALLLRRVQE